MSAHSCMQKSLGYIAACSVWWKYIDSSSPCSCLCPRQHLQVDRLSFSFRLVTRRVCRLRRCPSGCGANLHMSVMCVLSCGSCFKHFSGDLVQMVDVLAHSNRTFWWFLRRCVECAKRNFSIGASASRTSCTVASDCVSRLYLHHCRFLGSMVVRNGLYLSLARCNNCWW